MPPSKQPRSASADRDDPVHPGVTARFDDMSARTTTTLTNFRYEIQATSLDDVQRTIESAEHAAHEGRWVAGFVSYEAAPAFDAALAVTPQRNGQVPLAWFGVFASQEVCDIDTTLPPSPNPLVEWSIETSRDDYEARVVRIQDHIRTGQVYQVNLTTRVTSRDHLDPFVLYQQLLWAQQPAYGAFITTPDLCVVSASPELFFEWHDSNLRCRPMKGTRRRGRFAEEDRDLARDLLHSSKEQSENIMIVDLVRNDMAKVAELGSVHVAELLELEEYPQVFQLVSDVRCRTEASTRLTDVFAALFPGGSVTGAPKSSATRLISHIEDSPRGIYCGTVGRLAPSDRGMHATFNVAIRTATVTESRADFGTGGGIVADSQPALEYDEMVLKAQQLHTPTIDYSLLETFRYRPGETSEVRDRHLRRLQYSARRLGFLVPCDLAEFVESELILVTVDSRIRVLVAKDGTVSVEASSAPGDSPAPVRLALDDETVMSSDVNLFHKTTRRDIYDRRRRRFPTVDDVVMVNERGECTETTTANLAVRRGPLWFTPPLSSGCLPGIAREIELERARIHEGVIQTSDLLVAEEIAVFNSLRGWRRAEIDVKVSHD
jgi:para-aminobenzoate synthetase/4-amino-4-deoxychorismate lyase